jgi:radical SAM superfamily enzyme YgiQ (UPF0313 family)
LKKKSPHILFINPWIHDFAAYDFWAKPLGLLQLAAICRMHGFSVSYIDCQDRFHPKAKPSDPSAKYGRGAYIKSPIDMPTGLKGVKRRYCRYGIPPEWFNQDLAAMKKPDLILVTCLLTYWYPGLFETIQEIRKIYPEIPVIAGGVYATLCPEHAIAKSGADLVASGSGEENILNIVEQFTGVRRSARFDPDDLDSYPHPAFDLQHKIGYIPLLTSRGCPFSCTYCASNILQPKRMRRSPESVVNEIRHWHKHFGVGDFVFYDDALLIDAQNHADPIFEGVIQAGLDIRFHTPNAVHIREITKKTARLMFEAGVKTLRLGLETVDFEHRDIDRKVREEEFIRAVSYLKEAGFTKDQVGAYLLVGLPGQSVEMVEASIRTVKQSGIMPIPANYTPIPKTQLWDTAVSASRYDITADPIYTNNAIQPCQFGDFDWSALTRLKKLIEEN